MKTVRLTMAQALVRWLAAQRIADEGGELPLFAGVFAIFGHGNVTCLGEALEAAQDALPTWRGQNEQGMALAAVGFAKARRRRQIMVAAASIGPGAANMVTAAATAHANRLPVLLLAGDVFASRLPDPVLQQVEHFGNPGITVNDAFKPVTRYWDRIARPEQILQSLPQAVATMLDPADCGPAFLGLCQDVQGEAYDYPDVFFAPRIHRVPRPRPDRDSLAAAAELLRNAKRPLIVSGGGVHYSLATAQIADFAARHGVPVCETVAGRGALVHDHPCNVGPLGVLGASAANALAAEADVVLAVGTRLQDFTTGSWTVFRNPDYRLIALNAARFDATKHQAVPVVGDALAGIEELGAALGSWRAPQAWAARGAADYATWNATIDAATAPTNAERPSYAQVVGAINRACDPTDVVMTAAGGLPGELTKNWRVRTPGAFDCEFGFSCMGYEIAGAWGAKMALPDRDVITMLGDGSYLMMNSDIYSSVLSGHKLIVVLCDNGGFAVINRLQAFKGGKSFNNLLEHCRTVRSVAVDFARHAESMGAIAETVEGIAGIPAALARAKAADRTAVIVIKTDAHTWSGGDAWWDVATPQVSVREEIRRAAADDAVARKHQRAGV